MLFVLMLAIPMYLCATGSIPIAVALMLKGLSPGTALVLLMAGPAVNTASMLVIGKVLGKRNLLIYLLSIVAGAIIFGLLIDHFMPREWFTAPLSQIHAHCHEESSYFGSGCSILLAILLTNAFVQRYRHKAHCDCDSCACSKEKKAVIFVVEGMACNHCKASVEKALTAIEGVESVTVDLAEGKAAVEGSFDKEEAIKAVEAIGFNIAEENL